MTTKKIDIKKAITYESEFFDSLNTLMNQHSQLKGIKYFIDTAYNYFDLNNMAKRTPKVIILGTSIPEELIYAIGAEPFWILGGSLGTATWADDLVPRDTDPVNRSILGYLMNDKNNITENAVIIVPITCDSARKIVYLLRNAGRNVITVDIPPIKSDSFALIKWKEQMTRLVEELSHYTKKRMIKKSLIEAINKVKWAKELMNNFIALTLNKNEIISGALRMFVVNSYYFTEDINEWCQNLDKLNKELFMMNSKACIYEQSKVNILLMGSPVYFPNYKIPFLIQDIGLYIKYNVDMMTQKIYESPSLKRFGNNEEDIFTEIVQAQYTCDCSGAYIHNDTLYQQVIKQVKNGGIEGVVYHVLKGQIEYDFEMDRFEQMFSQCDIPVFRLETDYQYQDVEQLHIRMEAFMEMMEQNRHHGGKVRCQN